MVKFLLLGNDTSNISYWRPSYTLNGTRRSSPSLLVRSRFTTPHCNWPALQLQKQVHVYLEALDSETHSFEAYFDNLKADCMTG